MNNLPLILLGGGVVYFMLSKNKSSSAQKSETPEIKADPEKEVPKPKPLPKKKNPNPPPVDEPVQPKEAEEEIDLNSNLGISLYNTTEPGLFSIIKDPIGNTKFLPLMNVKIYSDQSPNIPLPLVVFVGPMNGVFNDPKTGPWVKEGEEEMIKGLSFPISARYAFIRPIKWPTDDYSTQYTELNNMIFGREPDLYSKNGVIVHHYSPNKASLELMLCIHAIQKKYPTTKVYVVGYSMGATIAYSLAKFTRRVDENMPIIDGILAISGFYKDEKYHDYGSEVLVGTPLAVIHGINDPYISISKGKEAYNQYGGPKIGFITAGFADHNLEQLKSTINESLKALLKNK
jgi:hypothetical protein